MGQNQNKEFKNKIKVEAMVSMVSKYVKDDNYKQLTNL